MEINRIQVYKVDLPIDDGPYRWSGGNEVHYFDSTIVRVETTDGLCGIGEICPLGASYLPSFAEGARVGIERLAPELIGCDPTLISVLGSHMDNLLKGHPYVKSALDMAFWDIMGKVAQMPIVALLGGRYGDVVDLYRAISQGSPDSMAEQVRRYRKMGYRRFQIKVGGDPDTDIERINAVADVLHHGDVLVADANTGWLPHQAVRVINAVRGLDIYIEQPCETYENCLFIRRNTDFPFVLDESIVDVPSLVRAISDNAMDVVNLKIGRLGGITKTRQLRDVCVSSGIAVTIEDSWGSDVVTSAVAHLAHSTPDYARFSASDFNSYTSLSTAVGAPVRIDGTMVAPSGGGLGIDLIEENLGGACLDIR
tara:strand:- start:2401 stop:3504 length:1104 start_codon:yes stop_codon:yes gene_type:complete